MKIPLLIIITLIFFILITGCVTEPPSKAIFNCTETEDHSIPDPGISPRAENLPA